MTTQSMYNTGAAMGNLNKQLGLQPKTLADWLAVTSGAQRTNQYGYFGPGHLTLNKDISQAGDTFSQADFFTNTFGAKVWDSLNSQTRAFNLFRKVAWGSTTGWRIRSGRNNSTRGVAERAALPTIDSPDLQSVYVQPSFIVTSIGVSALAQFLATLEGGLGDALAVAQEAAEVDHLKVINQMLLAPSEIRIATAANFGTDMLATVTLVEGGGEYVFEGDMFHTSDATVGTVLVTQVGTTTSDDQVILERLDGTGNLADDDVLFTAGRGGVSSLADIVNEDGRTTNGVTLTGGADYGVMGAAGMSAGAARTRGGWNAAGYVGGNAGVARHITTGLLDRAIQQVRINGFQPDLILTGVEQEVRLGTILQANQHFMNEGNFQVKQGGEATLPGYETGFEVSTYKKIPVFTDPDTSPTWQLPTPGDMKRGTDAYVLDTRYLEVPVLFTTQYMESRDYIHNNMLGIKAIFLTAANTRCLNFRAQARITDLSDGANLI